MAVEIKTPDGKIIAVGVKATGVVTPAAQKENADGTRNRRS